MDAFTKKIKLRFIIIGLLAILLVAGFFVWINYGFDKQNYDNLSNSYSGTAEKKLAYATNLFYLFGVLTLLVLVAVFYFVLKPLLNSLSSKNRQLAEVNDRLNIKRNKIEDNLAELKRLKADLEVNEKFSKIFVEQAPTSIAMLDSNMVYLAVSQQWIKDYNKEGEEIIGRSHYEVFPEIGDDWKKKHQECLKGAIDICDEAPFVREDGTVQWIFWDVRPWYRADRSIGGLLMYTGDITRIRNQRLERNKAEEIVERTNKVARIGAWDMDLTTNTVFWSKVVYEIHEVPEDYVPELETGLKFYKEGESRETIAKAINELITSGKPYDEVLEVITAKGNSVWIRSIGQGDFVNGECKKIYGVFQDVTSVKKIQSEVERKNELLSFAEEITLMGNWQWNVVENTVKWSKNLYKMFGLDEAERNLTYQTYFDFVHPEDKEKVTDFVEKSIEEKKFHKNFIHRIVASSGKTKIIHLLGRVVTNENGEVIELLGACQDVTEQRMAEIKFRGLLESAPDAMVIVNEKAEIQIINKQAELLFGYNIEELLGKPVETLIPEKFTINEQHMASRDGFILNPKTRYIGGSDKSRDLKALSKAGKEIPVQISLSPLQTEEGLLISAAVRDVTEQKRASDRILQAKENLEILARKLKTQNEQLGDFVHITSHNLRAPVSNLNSLVDFYKYAETENERNELFGKFESVVDHLTITLNTLVEALKKKNDQKKLEEVYFTDVLKKTEEMLVAQISSTKAIITSDFSKASKMTYNKVYLESIFLNLVENALKYRSEKRIPEIFIKSEIVNGKTKLKFQDNGLGIDLKMHGHKVFKLNKVFHRHPDARGVGLFMTKVQLEAMGGSISVSSEVEKGTTFYINLN